MNGHKCIITMDASAVGLGAVLCQKVGSSETTVALASRVLTSAERKYSTIEREALACAWTIAKFKTYVWGAAFTLCTDHKPLMYLLGDKGTSCASSRLTRILLKLHEYFDVMYIPGATNSRADCQSRLPIPLDETHNFDLLVLVMYLYSMHPPH